MPFWKKKHKSHGIDLNDIESSGSTSVGEHVQTSYSPNRTTFKSEVAYVFSEIRQGGHDAVKDARQARNEVKKAAKEVKAAMSFLARKIGTETNKKRSKSVTPIFEEVAGSTDGAVFEPKLKASHIDRPSRRHHDPPSDEVNSDPGFEHRDTRPGSRRRQRLEQRSESNAAMPEPDDGLVMEPRRYETDDVEPRPASRRLRQADIESDRFDSESEPRPASRRHRRSDAEAQPDEQSVSMVKAFELDGTVQRPASRRHRRSESEAQPQSYDEAPMERPPSQRRRGSRHTEPDRKLAYEKPTEAVEQDELEHPPAPRRRRDSRRDPPEAECDQPDAMVEAFDSMEPEQPASRRRMGSRRELPEAECDRPDAMVEAFDSMEPEQRPASRRRRMSHRELHAEELERLEVHSEQRPVSRGRRSTRYESEELQPEPEPAPVHEELEQRPASRRRRARQQEPEEELQSEPDPEPAPVHEEHRPASRRRRARQLEPEEELQREPEPEPAPVHEEQRPASRRRRARQVEPEEDAAEVQSEEVDVRSMGHRQRRAHYHQEFEEQVGQMDDQPPACDDHIEEQRPRRRASHPREPDHCDSVQRDESCRQAVSRRSSRRELSRDVWN